MNQPRAVLIEADGGSRGNPGPAAYGAVLKDADTGEVIAEDGTTIGVASNNVAEYRGLIAGLTMAADLLKLYDKLREQQGGIGAAKLYQRTCQGCRQELAITDINEIRAAAPDTVVRCENCRRILVRTSESGL